jgi:hypothetical protein
MLKNIGKSFVVCCATTLLVVFVGFKTVEATSELYYSEQEIEALFGHLDEQDSIIIRPGGTISHGESYTYELSNPDEKTYYNSDTDPEATTVGELKKRYRNTPRTILEAGATLNRTSPSGQVVELRGGAYDQPTSGFGGPGWRFANYLYKPADNTGGPYLKWSVFYDSAYIGDSGQAWNTYYGSPSGTALYPSDAPRYLTGSGSITTYYTFAPIQGSYYFVENR